MLLQYLIENLEDKEVIGNINVTINKIEYNSKKIEKGDLFVAISGFNEDGHNYIDEAIQKGAIAILVKKDHDIKEEQGITFI